MNNRCCEVRSDSHGGRGVYAKSALSSGTVLCSSVASAFAIDAQVLDKYCEWCLRGPTDAGDIDVLHSDPAQGASGEARIRKLLVCSQCSLMRYCSADHQRCAWRAGHRDECGSLKRIGRRDIGASVRLAARIIARRKNQSRSGAIGDSSTLADVSKNALDTLISHKQHYLADSRKRDALLGASFAVASVLLRDPTGRNLESVGEEIDVLCVLQANAATVCDAEQNVQGLGVFRAAAMFNHSCAPNCFQSFSYNQSKGCIVMTVRSTAPIAAGEELCITYIDLMQTRRQRQAELRAGYNFECECMRCTSEARLQDDDHYTSSIALDEIEKLRGRGDAESARLKVTRLLDLQTLPDILRARAWYLLSHILVDQRKFDDETVQACQTSINELRSCGIASNTAAVALQLAMLAKLEVYLGHFESAMSALGHAITALKILFGEREDVTLNCEILFEQARYELSRPKS